MQLENRVFAHPRPDGSYVWSEERINEDTTEFVKIELVEQLWEQYGDDPRFLELLRGDDADWHCVKKLNKRGT